MFAEQGGGNPCILSLRARRNLICPQPVFEIQGLSKRATTVPADQSKRERMWPRLV
jgi:hypothetical protein